MRLIILILIAFLSIAPAVQTAHAMPYSADQIKQMRSRDRQANADPLPHPPSEKQRRR
jgi:hypothetical protein